MNDQPSAASVTGQPSEDVAAEIAYGGGRSENIQIPARCTSIRCQTCKRATDDPAHVYGCRCSCKQAESDCCGIGSAAMTAASSPRSVTQRNPKERSHA